MKPLAEYKRKRNFRVTSEPGAKVHRSKKKALIFVVQEHHASHLHYDFRLEWKGVLKSWAVPKGPSMDPGQKRLAVEVEDHPKDYATFEGSIPDKEYGGGDVYRWDFGTWEPKGDVDAGLRKGRLEFSLKGKKLKGDFILVRTGRQASKPNWLLIKRTDDYAVKGDQIVPIAEYGSRRERPAAAKPSRTPSKPSKKSAKKKPAADLPDFTAPQLAQLVSKPPNGNDWLHEIKYDGYRIQAHCSGEAIKLYTRNGHVWTSKYRVLATALAKLSVGSAVLDGEVCWQDESGRSDFQKLQNAMKTEKTDALVYWVFDLLFLDGEDLRALPLLERKERLKKVIEDLEDPRIRFSEHFRGVGAKMFEASCQMNLEGIICKRADASYVSGRRDTWVKVKCVKRQEFVIGGFSDPEGSRVAFGSLLLGVYDGDQLRYVGKCGTGFDTALLRDLNKKLRRLESKKSPFALNAPSGRGLHWIKPEMVCEVSYAEMTEGGHLRAPVFKGLRQDKPPRQITIEMPKSVTPKPSGKTAKPKSKKSTAGKGQYMSEAPDQKSPKKAARHSTADGLPVISSPGRVMFLKEKLTKLDVAQYYQSVSKWMLPHISDRPLSLVRCPQDTTKPVFYSKHFPKPIPAHVIPIPEKGSEPWITVADEAGLMQLVQWGTLEIHPWNCHRAQIERPDQIVMDFDPEEGLDFEEVRKGAFEMRDLLRDLGLRSFVKTTGGKGLHVQFPFTPNYEWDTIKSFAKTLTQEFVSRHPDLYTANMSKKLRKGKIFLDYLRNGRGSTAVSPYAVRVRPVSAVAMPITWEELEDLKAPSMYTIPKALAWLAKRKKDPWADYFKVKQKIKMLEKSSK